MPGAGQLFLNGQPKLPRPQIADHRVDRVQRCMSFSLRRILVEKPVMPNRSGLHQMLSGRSWERGLSCLRHQMRDIAEKRRFNDLATVHPIELGIPKHRQFSCWFDAKPRRIEQPHEMSHRDNPAPCEPINLVQTSEKHILPTLHFRERSQIRAPKRRRHIGSARLNIEGMHPAPRPIRRNTLFKNAPNGLRRRLRQRIVVRKDKGLLGLKPGHVRLNPSQLLPSDR